MDMFSEFDNLPPVKQREKRKRGRPPTIKKVEKVVKKVKKVKKPVKTVDELYYDYLKLKQEGNKKPSFEFKREPEGNDYTKCVVGAYKRENDRRLKAGRDAIKWNEFEYKNKDLICMNNRNNPDKIYKRKQKKLTGFKPLARIEKKQLLNQSTAQIKEMIRTKQKLKRVEIQGLTYQNKQIPLEILTLPVLKNLYKSYGLKLSENGKTFNKLQLIERLKKLT